MLDCWNLSKGESFQEKRILEERERESLASSMEGVGWLRGGQGEPQGLGKKVERVCVCVCVCMRSSTLEAFHESLRSFLIK